MTKIKRVMYKNAELMKFNNTRVFVGSLNEDECVIELKVLSDDTRPRAIHRVHKGRVVVTGFKISKVGAFALLAALTEQLEKEGIRYNGTIELEK